MIITRLCCGLGNQMFHYALAKHLAIKNDTQLRFDISWWAQQDRYEDSQDWTKTLFEYDVMGEVATEEEVRSVLNFGDITHWMRGTKEFFRSSNPEKFHANLDYIPRLFPMACGKYLNYYREIRASPSSKDSSSEWPHRRRFCPAMLDIQGDAYLDGYWQSPKYFDEIAPEIREDLSIKDPLPGKNEIAADRIENTTAVSSTYGVAIRSRVDRNGTKLEILSHLRISKTQLIILLTVSTTRHFLYFQMTLDGWRQT